MIRTDTIQYGLAQKQKVNCLLILSLVRSTIFVVQLLRVLWLADPTLTL